VPAIKRALVARMRVDVVCVRCGSDVWYAARAYTRARTHARRHTYARTHARARAHTHTHTQGKDTSSVRTDAHIRVRACACAEQMRRERRCAHVHAHECTIFLSLSLSPPLSHSSLRSLFLLSFSPLPPLLSLSLSPQVRASCDSAMFIEQYLEAALEQARATGTLRCPPDSD
jgi:hypothetical protein